MALELESTVMIEIGLPSHYNRANGSGSCEYIRKTAAARLASTIQAHHDAGEAIEAPDQELVELVKMVAEIGDTSSYSLTRTWQACADAIRGHMEGQEGIAIAYEHIAKTYLPTADEVAAAKRDSYNSIS
jgi:hypothetical protein